MVQGPALLFGVADKGTNQREGAWRCAAVTGVTVPYSGA